MNWTVVTSKALDCISGSTVKDGDAFVKFAEKTLSPSVVSEMNVAGKKVAEKYLADEDLLVKCFAEESSDFVQDAQRRLKKSLEEAKKLGISLNEDSKLYAIKRIIIDNLLERCRQVEKNISAHDFLVREKWAAVEAPVRRGLYGPVGMLRVKLNEQSTETLLKLAEEYKQNRDWSCGYDNVCEELARRGVKMP